MPQLLHAPPCDGHEALAAIVRAEFATYADAVAALKQTVGKENFGKVSQRVERARIVYEVACEKLVEHLADHGCGSLDPIL